MKSLVDSPRFPSEGGSTWGPSPCGGLSPPPTTVAPLTSCPPSRPPRCYPCRPVLPSLGGRAGSPTFDERFCLHATLFDPGGAPGPCPIARPAVVPSGLSTPSAPSHVECNGAQSLQPEGLRPASSLSTLDPRRYRLGPRTRYGVCWVSTSPVALSATNRSPLRGAPTTISPGHSRALGPALSLVLRALCRRPVARVRIAERGTGWPERAPPRAARWLWISRVPSRLLLPPLSPRS